MKYKVLWIDDKPNDLFIVEADSYNMDIHVETCYNKGIEWLRVNRDICMAVILDVKCKITDDPNEGDRSDAFKEKRDEISFLCQQDYIIPWFVYTAGDFEGVEELNFLPINKIYDPGHRYYKKPEDLNVMLENIKRAIENREIVSYYKKYDKVIDFCPQMARELFRIITIVEKNDFTNTSAFNDMRKVIGWATAYMRNHGLFPENLTRIASASYYLKNISFRAKKFVPDYIRLSYETCADVCNNGSHGEMEGSTDETNNLIVDKVVANGEAQYLIRSTFYELMNILDWCTKLPTSEEEIALYREAIAKLNIQFDPNK